MKEVWKELPESNGQICVSNKGRVKTRRIFAKSERLRIIKAALDYKGYPRCCTWIDGVPWHKRVHRLVALTFIPNPENKPQINHINGKKTDNRVENLEWATAKENSEHAVKMGLYKPACIKGEQHGLTKTTNQQVLDIVKKVKAGKMLKDVACEYGISRCTVSGIMKGKAWSHITKIKSGKDRRKVLTRDQILEIVEMRKNGLLVKVISRQFGIGETTVSDICAGRSNWEITGLPKARK